MVMPLYVLPTRCPRRLYRGDGMSPNQRRRKYVLAEVSDEDKDCHRGEAGVAGEGFAPDGPHTNRNDDARQVLTSVESLIVDVLQRTVKRNTEDTLLHNTISGIV